MRKVEQVSQRGKVIMAPDAPKSGKEIVEILSRTLNLSSKKNPYEIEIGSKKITLLVKNVTYLGHPHPLHKKRIQIPKEWRPLLRNDSTFLIGLYSYRDTILFALFDRESYRKKKANNSAAHIHTIDLISALRYGVFEKTDARGNRIVVCKEEEFLKVIKREMKGIRELPPEIKMIDAFASGLEQKWDGKKSYDEMIRAKFAQSFQGEWPGFYLEYKFESFLSASPTYASICKYVQRKNKGELDFDLEFKDHLGDLKMHDLASRSVPGNDLVSFDKALKKHGRFWYVIVSSRSIKDRDAEYALTRYWNGLLKEHRGSKKEDDLSYGRRMKASVTLQEIMVAEVNSGNRKHLMVLRQGKNSNGKARNPKIEIPKKDIENFILYQRKIVT